MYKGSSGVTKQYVAESFSQITPGLPIPTAFRPFIEMMWNKNLYSGNNKVQQKNLITSYVLQCYRYEKYHAIP